MTKSTHQDCKYHQRVLGSIESLEKTVDDHRERFDKMSDAITTLNECKTAFEIFKGNHIRSMDRGFKILALFIAVLNVVTLLILKG